MISLTHLFLFIFIIYLESCYVDELNGVMAIIFVFMSYYYFYFLILSLLLYLAIHSAILLDLSESIQL